MQLPATLAHRFTRPLMRFAGFAALLLLLPAVTLAQQSPEPTQPAFEPRPGERTDLYIGRAFTFSQANSDSIPIAATTGSVTIHFSYNFLVNKLLSFRVQPGVSFYRLTFESNESKILLSPADSGYTDKLRIIYAELPIAVGFALRRDEINRVETLLEVGASFGYQVQNALKIRRRLDNGQVEVSKIENFENDDVNPFQVKLFTRLTYKIVGIYATYRVTDLFRDGSTFTRTDNGQPEPWPTAPRFEIGLSVNI